MYKVSQNPPVDREAQYNLTEDNRLEDIFAAVDSLFTEPRQPLPYFFCGDDWSIWTRHLIGSDGKENTSAPLAAQHLDSRSKMSPSNEYHSIFSKPRHFYSLVGNGTYFQGLLWDSVMGTGYFEPREGSPRTRFCGSSDTQWTLAGFRHRGRYASRH